MERSCPKIDDQHDDDQRKPALTAHALVADLVLLGGATLLVLRSVGPRTVFGGAVLLGPCHAAGHPRGIVRSSGLGSVVVRVVRRLGVMLVVARGGSVSTGPPAPRPGSRPRWPGAACGSPRPARPRAPRPCRPLRVTVAYIPAVVRTRWPGSQVTVLTLLRGHACRARRGRTEEVDQAECDQRDDRETGEPPWLRWRRPRGQCSPLPGLPSVDSPRSRPRPGTGRRGRSGQAAVVDQLPKCSGAPMRIQQATGSPTDRDKPATGLNRRRQRPGGVRNRTKSVPGAAYCCG